MAEAEKSTTSAALNSFAASFDKAGKKPIEVISAVQADLFKELQKIGEHWTTRTKTEADLASELVGRLTSARSVPEPIKNGSSGALRWPSKTASGFSRTTSSSWRLPLGSSRMAALAVPPDFQSVDERRREDAGSYLLAAR
jgi:hypothetical protein